MTRPQSHCHKRTVWGLQQKRSLMGCVLSLSLLVEHMEDSVGPGRGRPLSPPPLSGVPARENVTHSLTAGFTCSDWPGGAELCNKRLTSMSRQAYGGMRSDTVSNRDRE